MSDKILYAVLKALPRDKIHSPGVKFSWPEDGPSHFIPVFETREAAETWSEGSASVIELTQTL